MSDIFDQMVESWPAPVVARSEVARFSGGVLHPRTLANADSLGTGPKRINFGRKVAYPTKSLAEWMRSRTNPQGNDGGSHEQN